MLSKPLAGPEATAKKKSLAGENISSKNPLRMDVRGLATAGEEKKKPGNRRQKVARPKDKSR